MTASERIISEALAFHRLTVATAPDALELTEAQRHELDRRLADVSGPDDGIP